MVIKKYRSSLNKSMTNSGYALDKSKPESINKYTVLFAIGNVSWGWTPPSYFN